MPIVNADVRARRVVSAEDLSNDQEEVVEPSLLQRSLDRGAAFTLAERVALNVGMCRFRVSSGRIRIQRDNLIGRGVAELITLQHDLKRTEIEIAKNDFLRRDL